MHLKRKHLIYLSQQFYGDMTDTYKTIDRIFGNVIYKDRGSKFVAYAFPINSVDDVKACIERLKKEHHAARHWCYAWQLGVEQKQFRANDDGEPNNSAGMPIYGQILAKDLTNILIVVVRYFGGTKLGVGGLVTAYKTAAKLVLDEIPVVTKILKTEIRIQFEYAHMNKVMRIVKENQLEVLSQKMEMDCDFTIAIAQSNAANIKQLFLDLRCVKISGSDR